MHHHPRYENFRQDEYCNVGNNRVAGSPGNHGLYKSGLLLLCSTNKRTSVHNTKFSLSSVRIMIMSQLSFCMYGTCVLTWRMYNMTICINEVCCEQASLLKTKDCSCPLPCVITACDRAAAVELGRGGPRTRREGPEVGGGQVVVSPGRARLPDGRARSILGLLVVRTVSISS